MDATPRWMLPLLYAGQAQKELFHNEALMRLDLLVHGTAESADLNVPPGTPGLGQCWIVAAAPGGAWTDRGGALACWTEGGWRFVEPKKGLSIMVVDRGHRMNFDGAEWIDEALRSDGLYIAGQRIVGERSAAIADPAGGTTVDDEARAAIVALLEVLREHGLIAE
ncbi:hypothetical protein M529_04995 [Sphingobium ummariense RL-3]|uniref:DUF2793 domain-containing protein n=2 Tax=Sphingobium TaxID=165695 RepID=T0K9E9_9SPHN|nr:hypothetical protein M529_04995 [Sphingobium ummariense RL-3]